MRQRTLDKGGGGVSVYSRHKCVCKFTHVVLLVKSYNVIYDLIQAQHKRIRERIPSPPPFFKQFLLREQSTAAQLMLVRVRGYILLLYGIIVIIIIIIIASDMAYAKGHLLCNAPRVGT